MSSASKENLPIGSVLISTRIQDQLQSFGSGATALTLKDIEDTLNLALSRGGVFSELFFEESQSTRAVYEDNRIESIVDGTDRGVGLRVIFEGKQVFGHTTDLSRDSLLALAKVLSAAVKSPSKGSPTDATPEPRTVKFEWRESVQKNSDISKYQIEESPRLQSLSLKTSTIQKMDAATRACFRSDGSTGLIRQVTSIWMDSFRKILVFNSDALVSNDSKTLLSLVSQVVAEKAGRVESASEADGGYVGLEWFQNTSPESIAQEAARRVQVLLTALPAPSGTLPVVLSAEAGGTMIHEAVGHGLEADLACNGLSVYGGKLGTTVASPLITVIDDGTMLAKRGSFSIDDEGNPSQRNVLIENGVLKGYMVDRLSAMKFDLMATGNGRRESFRSKPIVRMTNTYIAPGKDDPEKILAETKWGIFVKSMGGGQVNTVTGDFVFGVTEAYLIRDGKLSEPIRGATLVGNGPQVLSIVDRVGNDLGFSVGTCGKDGQGAPVTDAQPTLRIPAITVGGEKKASLYFPEYFPE